MANALRADWLEIMLVQFSRYVYKQLPRDIIHVYLGMATISYFINTRYILKAELLSWTVFIGIVAVNKIIIKRLWFMRA